MPNDILFRPLTIKSLKLPNRIVMPPITRGMAVGGIPGQAQAAYYQRRAEGGVGFIVTEGTVVDRPASRNMPGMPFFYGEEALSGWAEVVKAVHDVGGHIAPQIWHTGSTRSGNWEPPFPVESPSGLVGPNDPRGVIMTDENIADTISAFTNAAASADKLGFDAIELHGAHGYLIDQFFWSGTNMRNDKFGGKTIKERSQFAAEIIRSIRKSIRPELPLILRVSQWKQQDYKARLATIPQEMTDWLAPLVEAGVDILDCSQRRFWEPEFPEIDGSEGLNFAGWAKKLTGAVTISVGSVGLNTDFFGAFHGESSHTASLNNLLKRMEKDEFDLIAVGRALISDPQWAKKVQSGQMDELHGFDVTDLATLK